MEFKFNNQDKDYQVDISENEQGLKIVVNGKEFLYDLADTAKVTPVPQVAISKRENSSKEVKAILAGIISDLFVKEGDVIKFGQKLLTLSAMKMENEILAECDGKISKILISKDQKVKEGEVLIVFA